MREWLSNDLRDKAAEERQRSPWILEVGEPFSGPGMLPLAALKEQGFVGLYKVGEKTGQARWDADRIAERTARQRPPE